MIHQLEEKSFQLQKNRKDTTKLLEGDNLLHPWTFDVLQDIFSLNFKTESLFCVIQQIMNSFLA